MNSLIGRKVRITKTYKNIIGRIGTIIDTKNTMTYKVELECGTVINPYRENIYCSECDLLPEYHIENLKGKEFTLDPCNLTKATKILEILKMAGYKWDEELEEECCVEEDDSRFSMNKNLRINFRCHPNIINLDKFIEHNKEFLTKKEEKMENKSFSIHGGSKHVREAFLKELKELGFCSKSNDINNSFINSNKAFLYLNGKEKEYTISYIRVCDVQYFLPNHYEVALHTFKESLKPKEVIVYIGDNNTPVTISKDKIFMDQHFVEYQNVRVLIDQLIMAGKPTRLPWTLFNPKIDISCAKNVTIEQLQKVLDTYNELNK